jgi:hypothetical protein
MKMHLGNHEARATRSSRRRGNLQLIANLFCPSHTASVGSEQQESAATRERTEKLVLVLLRQRFDFHLPNRLNREKCRARTPAAAIAALVQSERQVRVHEAAATLPRTQHGDLCSSDPAAGAIDIEKATLAIHA